MMPPYKQDFHGPRRLSFWGASATPRSRLWSTLTLCLGLVAATASAWALWQGQEDHKALVQEADLLRQELQELTARKPQHAMPVSSSDTAAQEHVIHQLNMPWAAIFATLEEATPEGIALVSLEPAGTGAIRLQTESLSLDRLLEHAASLQASGPFGDLVYTRHETHDRDPNRPVRLRFELALKEGQRP